MSTQDRVFNCRDRTLETKLKLYNQCIISIMTRGKETWNLDRNQCVIPLMMHGNETWTSYRHRYVNPLMIYGEETWTLYRHQHVNQCVIPLMMYGTRCRHHIKLLRTVQQRHLRSIHIIRWKHYVRSDEVSHRAKAMDIEIIAIRNRLRRMGHFAGTPDHRPVIHRTGRF